MENRKNATSTLALILGVFLLIEGIWGMFSPVVFMVLSTNKLHAAIHIILGIIGIYTGYKNTARGYCIFVGFLLLIVGILRFVPGINDVIINLLNVNYAVAYFNIAVGIVLLAATYFKKEVPATNS